MPDSSPAIYTRSALGRTHTRYTVMVSNLNPKTCWQELKDFGRLGGTRVEYCDIHKFDRGGGFINYLTQEDAERAARRLNGKILLGNIVEAVPYFQDMNPRGRQMPTRRSRDRFCSLQNRGGRPGEETCGQPTLSGVHVRHGAYDKSFVPYRTRLSCEYSMRSDKHSSRSECPPIWPHPKLERGEYQESDSVPHLSDNGCTDIDRIAAWCLGRDHDRKPRVY